MDRQLFDILNKLPITYGRVGGPSWAVMIAVSAYVREGPEYETFGDE